MAFKHKAISAPFFRAFSRTPSISGFITSFKTGSRCLIHTTSPKEAENFGPTASMQFVREIMDSEARNNSAFALNRQADKSDIVHIKMFKNNTFVTITDSKGNKKAGVSAGCLEELKSGTQFTKFAAEATAERAGRMSRDLGLKSVVMKVNGFLYFKKKKQAIMSWRDGFNLGRGDRNPITHIEDTTRRPHNGCRKPKKRRY